MRLAAALGGLLLLAACADKGAPPPPAEEAKLRLESAAFTDLPGWNGDNVAAAWPALERSCRLIGRSEPARAMAHGTTAADWQRACAAVATAPTDGFRQALEGAFQPFRATADGNPTGLFTGYYEAELKGSRTQSARFRYPLYKRPEDLVTVDLGEFRESLKGQRIAGRITNGALKPYPDRAAIDKGALSNKGLEIAWVEDPVDAFFLHIQGSGRVTLPDGGTVRVGYAAQNGHPYLAIGRPLVERGAIPSDRVSMQSIRAWLAANPAEADRVMWLNASYVFFREIAGEGPIGAQGVPLTPGRSLAIDPRFIPLGAPVWLDTTEPSAAENGQERPLQRLLVAQDTGGAIKGPVRGDVFFGFGAEPMAVAGRMKQRGQLWLLLPRGAVPSS